MGPSIRYSTKWSIMKEQCRTCEKMIKTSKKVTKTKVVELFFHRFFEFFHTFSASESVLDPPGWPPDPPGSIEKSPNKFQNLSFFWIFFHCFVIIDHLVLYLDAGPIWSCRSRWELQFDPYNVSKDPIGCPNRPGQGTIIWLYIFFI